MARPWTNDRATAGASFTPIDTLNDDAYSGSYTDGPFTIPGAPCKHTLDYRPKRGSLVLTVGGVAAALKEWGAGQPVASGQVAVDYLHGYVWFAAADAGKAVVATYEHYGSVLDSHTFNTLQNAFTTAQGDITTLETAAAGLDTRLDTAESAIAALQASGFGSAKYVLHVGKSGCPYSTIQQAINAIPTVGDDAASASKPYVIFVHAGVYDEKLTMNKPYTAIIGEGAESTIIRTATTGTVFAQTGDGNFPLQITGDGVTVANLQINNTSETGYGPCIILGLEESDRPHDVTVRNVFLNAPAGKDNLVALPDSNGLRLLNSRVKGLFDCVSVWGSSAVLLESTEIEATGAEFGSALWCLDALDLMIHDCRQSAGEIGIIMGGTNTVTFDGYDCDWNAVNLVQTAEGHTHTDLTLVRVAYKTLQTGTAYGTLSVMRGPVMCASLAASSVAITGSAEKGQATIADSTNSVSVSTTAVTETDVIVCSFPDDDGGNGGAVAVAKNVTAGVGFTIILVPDTASAGATKVNWAIIHTS